MDVVSESGKGSCSSERPPEGGTYAEGAFLISISICMTKAGGTKAAGWPEKSKYITTKEPRPTDRPLHCAERVESAEREWRMATFRRFVASVCEPSAASSN